jgi:Zn-dependent protease
LLTDDLFAAIPFFAVLLLSLSWHEAAHAWVADKLGDPTARQLGRVTLNPIKHLDPFLSFILPLILFFSFGFAIAGGKPVPVDVRYFKRTTRDFMYVALAGPGSNILLSLLFGVVYVGCYWSGLVETGMIENPGGADIRMAPSLLEGPPTQLLGAILWAGIFLNIALAMFNLIPIPPLDGSRVIGWMLPRFAKRTWFSFDRAGVLIVLVVVFVFDGFAVFWSLIQKVIAVYDRGLLWLFDQNPFA